MFHYDTHTTNSFILDVIRNIKWRQCLCGSHHLLWRGALVWPAGTHVTRDTTSFAALTSDLKPRETVRMLHVVMKIIIDLLCIIERKDHAAHATRCSLASQ